MELIELCRYQCPPGESGWDGEKLGICGTEGELGFRRCYAPTYSLSVEIHETKERNSGCIINDFPGRFQVSFALSLQGIAPVPRPMEGKS